MKSPSACVRALRSAFWVVAFGVGGFSDVRADITVAFDSCGGSEITSHTYGDGDSFGALPEPARDGYIFAGWFTDRFAGEVVLSNDVVTASHDVVYAHWVQVGLNAVQKWPWSQRLDIELGIPPEIRTNLNVESKCLEILTVQNSQTNRIYWEKLGDTRFLTLQVNIDVTNQVDAVQVFAKIRPLKISETIVDEGEKDLYYDCYLDIQDPLEARTEPCSDDVFDCWGSEITQICRRDLTFFGAGDLTVKYSESFTDKSTDITRSSSLFVYFDGSSSDCLETCCISNSSEYWDGGYDFWSWATRKVYEIKLTSVHDGPHCLSVFFVSKIFTPHLFYSYEGCWYYSDFYDISYRDDDTLKDDYFDQVTVDIRSSTVENKDAAFRIPFDPAWVNATNALVRIDGIDYCIENAKAHFNWKPFHSGRTVFELVGLGDLGQEKAIQGEILVTEGPHVTFSHVDGHVFDGEICFSIETDADDATIHYTLDGSAPTRDSPVYEGAIHSDMKVSVRAVAILPDGYVGFASDEVHYYNYRTPTPCADIPDFTYGSFTLAFETVEADTVFYYQINGGTYQVYTEPVVLQKTAKVCAYAVKEGFAPSALFERNVVIRDGPFVTFSHAKDHVFEGEICLSLTTDASDATIHYTLDGSLPTAESPVYAEPIRSDHKISIRAVAILANGYVGTPSEQLDYYNYRVQTPSTGVTEFTNGVCAVVFDDLGGETRIYYQIDGGTYQVYEGPIILLKSATVCAYAVREGWAQSSVFERRFRFQAPPGGCKSRITNLSIVPHEEASAHFDVRYTIEGVCPKEFLCMELIVQTASRTVTITNTVLPVVSGSHSFVLDTEEYGFAVDDAVESLTLSLIDMAPGLTDRDFDFVICGGSATYYGPFCFTIYGAGELMFNASVDTSIFDYKGYSLWSIALESPGTSMLLNDQNYSSHETTCSMSNPGSCSVVLEEEAVYQFSSMLWAEADFYNLGFPYDVRLSVSFKGVHRSGVMSSCRAECIGGKFVTTFWTPDPIPDLGENPNEADLYSVLWGNKDARLVENITTGETYARYRTWANRVRKATGGDLAGQQTVQDSEQAWMAFALDSPRLIEKLPRSNDFRIEASAADGTARTFDLTVGLADIEIGDGATEDNLKKLFTAEGAASLDAMSPDNVSLSFGKPANGKLKVSVSPKDPAQTFFMRMIMNP